MDLRYFLWVSTLLLTACGSEAEVLVVSEPIMLVKAKAVEVAEPSSSYKDWAVATESAQIPTVAVDDTISETDASDEFSKLPSQQAEHLLPLGRLVGIVDTGTDKQAIINDQGKVIRLREGDDWQGWTVGIIGRKKVAISQGDTEHSLLLLGELRAPESMNNKLVNQPLPDNQGAGVPQFTEAQLLKLRSRLLMGRSEQ